MRGTSRRRSVAGAVVALALAWLSCGPPASAAVGAAGVGSSYYTVSSAKGSMSYALYIPPTAKRGAPLMVHLHGGNEDVAVAAAKSGLNELALARGFVVAYPQEDADNGRNGIWNWSGAAQEGREGRASSLVANVTRDVLTRASIDQRRVFISGFSAGGAMTVVMAAQYPDLYKAFMSEAGVMYNGATGPLSDPTGSLTPEDAGAKAYLAMAERARRMPFIVSAGELDAFATYSNQAALTRQWLVTNDWVDDRAANGSISREPAESETGNSGGLTYSVEVYTDAAGCVLGERYRIDGMGHDYAGGHPQPPLDAATSSVGPNLREIAYDFFLSQTASAGPRGPSGAGC